MQTLLLKSAAATIIVCSGAVKVGAQTAPPSADKVWHAKGEDSAAQQLASLPKAEYELDPAKTYTLAELIDLAEQHNPQTRLVWQQAKARAAELGIARSLLYPNCGARGGKYIACSHSYYLHLRPGHDWGVFAWNTARLPYLRRWRAQRCESTRRRPICSHPILPSMTA